MMRQEVRAIMWLFAIIVCYYGFRFVTQAGQGLGVVQNDGYGGTGGFMILVAGIVIGLLINNRDKKG